MDVGVDDAQFAVRRDGHAAMLFHLRFASRRQPDDSDDDGSGVVATLDLGCGPNHRFARILIRKSFSQ